MPGVAAPASLRKRNKPIVEGVAMPERNHTPVAEGIMDG